MEHNMESNFTQGNRLFDFNPVKRTFKILVADGETIGTNPLTGNQLKYNPKSHAKALSEWPGKPVIINHGKLGIIQVGEIIDADIVEKGLVHQIRVDDDRMLELLNKNAYEGFSIGSAFDPNDPTTHTDTEVLSYHPVELSVIMYPLKPACPKGVCDIISMMVSCTHSQTVETTNPQEDEQMSKNELESCEKCKSKEYITSAEHKVAMAAKDEELSKARKELATLSEKFTAYETEVNSYRSEKKATLISSLPKVEGLEYEKMTIPELTNLVSFYTASKSESAGAVETGTGKEAEKSNEKPWLPKNMKPGSY